VRRLAELVGGTVRASDLEARLGWQRKQAVSYLVGLCQRGHFVRQEAGARPLEKGKFEPLYKSL
jgi:hypothetical protein